MDANRGRNLLSTLYLSFSAPSLFFYLLVSRTFNSLFELRAKVIIQYGIDIPNFQLSIWASYDISAVIPAFALSSFQLSIWASVIAVFTVPVLGTSIFQLSIWASISHLVKGMQTKVELSTLYLSFWFWYCLCLLYRFMAFNSLFELLIWYCIRYT